MSTSTGFSKTDTKTLIKWIAIIGVPVLIYLLPTGEVFTEPIKLFFAITVFGILTFVLEPFDYAIGSLLMMSFYILSGLSTMDVVFKPFTQNIPWMVYGCLLLINIIQNRTKIIERIACFCMIKTGGTYNGIIYGLILLGIIINIVVPGVFTSMAVCVLAYGICEALNLGKGRASSGIMLAAIVGFIEAWTFVFCPPDLGVLIGIASAATPMTMDYFTYFKHCLVFVPFPFLMGFVITRLCKPEIAINGKAYFMERQKELGRLTGQEKRVIAVLIVFVLYLFTAQWHKQDMMWGFLFAPLALFMPGLKVGEKEDIKGVNFPMIMFVVGCMSIGGVAAQAGVAQMISDAAMPLLVGRSNTFFVLFTFFFVAVFNFVMTPMALMAAFSVPLSQIALDMGMSPLPMLYAFSRGCYSVLLPYEAVIIAAAFAFGNTKMECFLKVFGAKLLLTAIWILLIACPYWSMLGLMG